jgi:endonuclease/exonuclease/phosphatase family metal-dependent hydrolase
MITLRVVTYNIHKGVQGLGPRRRLEIHNLGQAIKQWDADLLCLQEVRKLHRREAEYFTHWPDMPQADFLAPEGYTAVYRTNAYTQHGEHGNALLSRWPVVAQQHEDMSDHRLEQRGLLHAEVSVQGHSVHVIVIHLGLIRSSRVRQVEQILQFVAREVPAKAPLIIAGDFNDWGDWLPKAMSAAGLKTQAMERNATFPSRLPLLQLDHIFARGMALRSLSVPRGREWARMSDHLPLVSEWSLERERV